jgi:hypothetical protein
MILSKHKFFRRDNRIKADLVRLQKTLNVAKKEKEPRISQLALSEAERGLRGFLFTTKEGTKKDNNHWYCHPCKTCPEHGRGSRDNHQ